MVIQFLVFFTTIHFVRGGDINLDNATLRHSGDRGYDRSQFATDYGTGKWSASAYYFDFDPSGTFASANYIRWLGFPVRCLVYYVIVKPTKQKIRAIAPCNRADNEPRRIDSRYP